MRFYSQTTAIYAKKNISPRFTGIKKGFPKKEPRFLFECDSDRVNCQLSTVNCPLSTKSTSYQSAQRLSCVLQPQKRQAEPSQRH